MCNRKCIEFVQDTITATEVYQKSVLEVGSQDVNGSVRPSVEKLFPSEYIGVDIEPGSRVDLVCDAVDLVRMFGAERFDVALSTEMVEHVPDWRSVMSNFKRVLKPGGVLLITTRSVGFPYHGYPHDYWRYGVGDMQAIFADMDILALMPDPYEAGVFLKAKKPLLFEEKDLSGYALYSINELKRIV